MSRAAILVLRCSRLAGDTLSRSAGLMEVAEIWRTLKNDLVNSYRPELHYMRGPGPKWLEKHSADRSLRS